MSARTANWIAAARARESTRPDRLFDDPRAAQLAYLMCADRRSRRPDGSAGPQGFDQLAGPDNPFLST
jgi:O-methyltransferase involved in polyketide biosynthesis